MKKDFKRVNIGVKVSKVVVINGVADFFGGVVCRNYKNLIAIMIAETVFFSLINFREEICFLDHRQIYHDSKI